MWLQWLVLPRHNTNIRVRMRPWAFYVVCMGSLSVLQLLPRKNLTKGSWNRFQHLIHPWPNRLFSLYLSHTSAFASSGSWGNLHTMQDISSDTVLPGGTCIIGSSQSLRLSYFGGETQRKVLTVCFKWGAAWLLEFNLVSPSSSVLPVTLQKGGSDNEKSHCVQSFIL